MFKKILLVAALAAIVNATSGDGNTDSEDQEVDERSRGREDRNSAEEKRSKSEKKAERKRKRKEEKERKRQERKDRKKPDKNLKEGKDRGSGKRAADKDYLQYQAQYNKHWLTAVDLDEHQHLFHETDDYIKMINHQADLSGDPNALRLGHNTLSDLDFF